MFIIEIYTTLNLKRLYFKKDFFLNTLVSIAVHIKERFFFLNFRDFLMKHFKLFFYTKNNRKSMIKNWAVNTKKTISKG